MEISACPSRPGFSRNVKEMHDMIQGEMPGKTILFSCIERSQVT